MRLAKEVADSASPVLLDAKETLQLHFLAVPRPLPPPLFQPQASRLNPRWQQAGELPVRLNSRGRPPGVVGLGMAASELAVPATPRSPQHPRLVETGMVALVVGLWQAVPAEYHRCSRHAPVMIPSGLSRCYC